MDPIDFGLPREHRAYEIGEGYRAVGAADRIGGSEQEIKDVSRQTAKGLNTPSYGFDFIKVLGWGGYGVAALLKRWGVLGPKSYCVAKYRFDGSFDELEGEMEMFKVSARRQAPRVCHC